MLNWVLLARRQGLSLYRGGVSNELHLLCMRHASQGIRVWRWCRPVGRASFKLALLLIRVPVPRAAPHAFICDPLAPPSGLSVELQGDILTGQRKDQPRKDASSHPVREGKKGMEGCGR